MYAHWLTPSPTTAGSAETYTIHDYTCWHALLVLTEAQFMGCLGCQVEVRVWASRRLKGVVGHAEVIWDQHNKSYLPEVLSFGMMLVVSRRCHSKNTSYCDRKLRDHAYIDRITRFCPWILIQTNCEVSVTSLDSYINIPKDVEQE